MTRTSESTAGEVFTLIAQLSTALHNVNMQVQKETGVSLVQWETLRRIIDKPGLTAGELSKATGVHPSTTTQILKRLENERWIVLAEHPKDSRKRLIVISKVGREMFDKTKHGLQKLFSSFKIGAEPLKVCISSCSTFLSVEVNLPESAENQTLEKNTN